LKHKFVSSFHHKSKIIFIFLQKHIFSQIDSTSQTTPTNQTPMTYKHIQSCIKWFETLFNITHPTNSWFSHN